MGVVIVIAIIAIVSIILFTSNTNADIPPITNVNSIKGIVMFLNQGRIYPFYTRMNFVRFKKAVEQAGLDNGSFKLAVMRYEMTGDAPIFMWDVSNECIESITIRLNKKGIVFSISIKIKDFKEHTKELLNEMAAKFGEPTSMDDFNIKWEEGGGGINVDVGGSITIYDKLITPNA